MTRTVTVHACDVAGAGARHGFDRLPIAQTQGEGPSRISKDRRCDEWGVRRRW